MPSNFHPSTPNWAKSILQNLSQRYGVNTFVLSSQINQESGFNPRARGYNRDKFGNITSVDRGIAQINNYWNPGISDKQADDPMFALNWMAKTMAEKYNRLGDWGKALSEYNTGNGKDGFKNGYVKKVLGSANSQEMRIQELVQRPAQQPNLQPQQPQANNVFESVKRLLTPKQPKLISPIPTPIYQPNIEGSAPSARPMREEAMSLGSTIPTFNPFGR